MKIIKSKFIIVMLLSIVVFLMPKVYAKTSIEIKPNANTVYTGITISECFDETINMKESGEGLEGDNVDVHMAKNTEWAIVSYFSNSVYGTNGEGQNYGVAISMNGKEYLSTNGNATGVMDFGKTNTFTSGLISNYTEIPDTSDVYLCGIRIIENATNNKYVDLMPTPRSDIDMKQRGVVNYYNQRSEISDSVEGPYSYRCGFFRTDWGCRSHGYTFGSYERGTTFRPIIWN